MSKDIEKIIKNLSDKEREDLIKALVQGADKPDQDPKEDNEEIVIDDKFVIKNRKPKVSRGRTQVKAGKNQWMDKGENRDVETPDFERTPRRKASTSKVKVECHVCGKHFKADPRYVYGEYHRCNKCTGR